MAQWKERRRRPVLPLYLAALAWPLAALALPVHTPGGLLGAAALSAAVGIAASVLCPDRVERIAVPAGTGDGDTDALLATLERDLDALHALNEDIPDAELSAAMDRMERAGRGIVAVVSTAPAKARQADRLVRYYLPESLKILGAWAELERNGVRGENAAHLFAEIRASAQSMAAAFENQLDALYADEALSLSADIEVLDNIFQSQSLGGS